MSFNAICENKMTPKSFEFTEFEPAYEILVLPSQCGWECSYSVEECLTRDRGAVGLSLTGTTALCP